VTSGDVKVLLYHTTVLLCFCEVLAI